MLDSTSAFDLINQIYDASVAPDLWQVFLAGLAAAVGGGAAQIALSLPREGNPGVSAATWRNEVALREYAEYFHAHDPWMQRTHEIPSALGTPVDWGALEPPEHTRRTLFWNDFLRLQGIGYEPPLAVILRREGRRSTSGCSVHPLEGQRPYGADETHLMEVLGPHLVRAMRIHELVSEHQSARSSEAEALDRIRLGVLLVDTRGRIIQANSFARRLLAEADGLRSEAGHLASAKPTITHSLGRLIGEAAGAASDPSSQLVHRMGGALSLPRPDPRRPLEVLVTPARPGSAGWEIRGPLATVFVSDPDERSEAPIEVLRRLYGLTPAEASLAAKLGAGATLDEVGETLGLTRNTVRFYLKRVFAKTGTSRQAELVRLLTIGVGRLAPGERSSEEPAEED